MPTRWGAKISSLVQNPKHWCHIWGMVNLPRAHGCLLIWCGYHNDFHVRISKLWFTTTGTVHPPDVRFLILFSIGSPRVDSQQLERWKDSKYPPHPMGVFSLKAVIIMSFMWVSLSFSLIEADYSSVKQITLFWSRLHYCEANYSSVKPITLVWSRLL